MNHNCYYSSPAPLRLPFLLSNSFSFLFLSCPPPGLRCGAGFIRSTVLNTTNCLGHFVVICGTVNHFQIQIGGISGHKAFHDSIGCTNFHIGGSTSIHVVGLCIILVGPDYLDFAILGPGHQISNAFGQLDHAAWVDRHGNRVAAPPRRRRSP